MLPHLFTLDDAAKSTCLQLSFLLVVKGLDAQGEAPDDEKHGYEYAETIIKEIWVDAAF